MTFTVEDETPEETARREKERMAERLNGPEAVPLFSAFMAASMASGKTPKLAAGDADVAMAELKKRFT